MQDENFQNCKACNRAFFTAIASYMYCSQCSEAEEETFRSVRDYLYSHPRSTALDIYEAIGVPVAKILDYVREGRIECLPD